MSQTDRGFAVALAAAELSDAPRPGLRLGAALFNGSRLLSVGANVFAKSHPASQTTRSFTRNTHAEIAALLRRRHYDIPGTTLYVARRLFDGTLGCSKPCRACQAFCRLAGVKRIYYIERDGSRQEIKL